jgi:hypothetical protein
VSVGNASPSARAARREFWSVSFVEKKRAKKVEIDFSADAAEDEDKGIPACCPKPRPVRGPARYIVPSGAKPDGSAST